MASYIEKDQALATLKNTFRELGLKGDELFAAVSLYSHYGASRLEAKAAEFRQANELLDESLVFLDLENPKVKFKRDSLIGFPENYISLCTAAGKFSAQGLKSEQLLDVLDDISKNPERTSSLFVERMEALGNMASHLKKAGLVDNALANVIVSLYTSAGLIPLKQLAQALETGTPKDAASKVGLYNIYEKVLTNAIEDAGLTAPIDSEPPSTNLNEASAPPPPKRQPRKKK